MASPDPITDIGTVPADYHAFWLIDRSAPSGVGEGVVPRNGLVEQSAPGAIRIETGIAGGSVDVEVEVRSEPPEVEDVRDWDDVAEVSIDVPGDELLVTSLFAFLPRELPNLVPSGPGPYRVRVHARGRDTAVDSTQSGVERYKIVTWPSPSSASRTLKATDAYGASVRARRGPG